MLATITDTTVQKKEIIFLSDYEERHMSHLLKKLYHPFVPKNEAICTNILS